MPPRKLLHYLRSYRKIVGLSQEELARLLGCQYGTKVSRYEQFQRSPALVTAIAYEIIFQAPLKSMFAGLYSQVEERVRRQARSLLAEVERRAAPRQGTLRVLRALAESEKQRTRRV